jgi:hypothetical protein
MNVCYFQFYEVCFISFNDNYKIVQRWKKLKTNILIHITIKIILCVQDSGVISVFERRGKSFDQPIMIIKKKPLINNYIFISIQTAFLHDFILILVKNYTL